jgi:hypothetical protein
MPDGRACQRQPGRGCAKGSYLGLTSLLVPAAQQRPLKIFFEIALSFRRFVADDFQDEE